MSAPHVTMYRRATGRGRFAGITGTRSDAGPVGGPSGSGGTPGTDPAVAAGTAEPAGGPASRLVTISFDARQLGGDPPRVGDRYSDPAGQWWTVQSVGAPANGLHPCLCAKAEG